MKIVDYDTFVKMPSGVIYADYEPMIFGDLCVKGETINDGRDWFLSRLTDSFADEGDVYLQFHEQVGIMESGKDLRGDYDIQERDGMFDYDRKFLIYNDTDIQDLINKLSSLLSTAKL